MQPKILVEQLNIHISPMDASYMPALVVVHGGPTVGGLKELKTSSIPSTAKEFTVISGLTQVSFYIVSW